MMSIIVLILIVVMFIIASIEDIKKREVYDYLNYSLAFFIIVISIFDSLVLQSFEPLKYVGFGLLVGFAIGSLLYYLGIWGGGDAKFLIGFAGSSYYLMDFMFVNQDAYISNMYDYFISIFSNMLNIFLDFTLNIIIVIDIIFLLLIIISLFIRHRRTEKINLIVLFLILLFLTLGLSLNWSAIYLILFGFISFVLIFFADEEMFSCVYIRKEKNTSQLLEGMSIDKTIKTNKHKLVVDFDEGKFGLTKEHILNIRNKLKSQQKIIIRKIIPYSILIAVNYIVYILKIITLDKTNLSILTFLFKFLFYSFCAGGIIAILMLFIFYIKNFKKVKISVPKKIKMLSYIVLILGVILTLIDMKFIFLPLIVVLYYFIKTAKQIEKLMFVEKKDLKKVVLGDWIVQDIKVDKKLIYSADEFKLGIDEKQLIRIKELAKKYKELNYLYVKDGLAFLPPLFIGFILMFFI